MSIPQGQGQDTVVSQLLYGEASPLLAWRHGRVGSASIPAC